MEDMKEFFNIPNIIESINYDYIHLAWHTERFMAAGDVQDIDAHGNLQDIDVQRELMQSIIECNALMQHLQELLDVLYPRLQDWS